MSHHHEAIHLAGGTLTKHRHVCAFFRDAEERYRVLMPFIKEGFERGDRAFHIIDPRERQAHERRLTSADIDVAQAQRDGQFELGDWDQAYLDGGRFDQDRMLALFEQHLGQGQQVRSVKRTVCQMEWSLEDRPGVHDLIEYETRFNLMSQRFPDPVVCCYDVKQHSAATIMDMLRTHPMVILGGVLQVNPFFTPPDEFLRELAQRRRHGDA